MKLEIVGEITHIETIAQGNGIRDLSLLKSQHGLGSWGKKKGIANVRLLNGDVGRSRYAESRIRGGILKKSGSCAD